MSPAGWIVIIGLLYVCPFYEAAETTGNRNASRKFSRKPRSFVNLAALVFEATRRNPGDFFDYGNWCGIGGEGEPVDAIDVCCLRHDLCYDMSTVGHCKGQNPITYTYEWSVTKDDTIICDTVDPCGETVCACDKMVANCLKRHAKSYNPENHGIGLDLLEALYRVLLPKE